MSYLITVNPLLFKNIAHFGPFQYFVCVFAFVFKLIKGNIVRLFVCADTYIATHGNYTSICIQFSMGWVKIQKVGWWSIMYDRTPWQKEILSELKLFFWKIHILKTYFPMIHFSKIHFQKYIFKKIQCKACQLDYYTM